MSWSPLPQKETDLEDTTLQEVTKSLNEVITNPTCPGLLAQQRGGPKQQRTATWRPKKKTTVCKPRRDTSIPAPRKVRR